MTAPFFHGIARAAERLGQPPKPAFEVGEKLTYSLGWQFIVAGHATLEVLPDEDWEGREARSFQMTAKTNKTADALFEVRDTCLLYTSDAADDPTLV